MAELRARSHVLDKPKIEEYLKSKRDGVLSFTDGTSAYGVPLGYAYYDSDNGCLYFGMNPGGRKYDYFKKSNQVFVLREAGMIDIPAFSLWSILTASQILLFPVPSRDLSICSD